MYIIKLNNLSWIFYFKYFIAEVQDDIAHIVTTDDSETQGDSLEITDAETSKSAEEETQENDDKSVEEIGQSKEQDASAETVNFLFGDSNTKNPLSYMYKFSLFTINHYIKEFAFRCVPKINDNVLDSSVLVWNSSN